MELDAVISELLEKLDEIECVMNECPSDPFSLVREYLQQIQEELESISSEE